MPYLEENKLKKHLESREFTPIYAFFGNEKYLVKKAYRNMFSIASKCGFEEFNLNSFSGDAAIDDIADAALALPFMEEKKFVFVSDYNIENKNSADLNKITELVSDPSEDTVLVLFYPTLDFDPKKSTKWKNFFKIIEKNGTIVEFKEKERPELIKFITAICEKENALISKDLAGRVADYVGSDLNSIMNETIKLASFCKNREITREDVENLVTKTPEAKIFSLSKAIIASNTDEAYEIIDNLLYFGEKPVGIVSVLSGTFIDMYRVKAALNSGARSEDLTDLPEYKGKEFRLKNAERDVRNISLNKLRRCLDILLEADVQLKSSRVSGELILQQLVANLLFTLKIEN